MINEPLDNFFNSLMRQMKKTAENLEKIGVDDVRFVKTERVVWITPEGFYGIQNKRLPLNEKLEYIRGVNMFVFIDSKWTYVVFDGKFGYKFKLKDLNPLRMDYLKSWGEPRTLDTAKKEFEAVELDFGFKQKPIKEKNKSLSATPPSSVSHVKKENTEGVRSGWSHSRTSKSLEEQEKIKKEREKKRRQKEENIKANQEVTKEPGDLEATGDNSKERPTIEQNDSIYSPDKVPDFFKLPD